MELIRNLPPLSRRNALVIGAGLLLGLSASTFTALPAKAETFKVKIAHVDTVEHPKHLAFLKFKEIAEERSGGRLQVTIYHGGQLGDERETIEGAPELRAEAEVAAVESMKRVASPPRDADKFDWLDDGRAQRMDTMMERPRGAAPHGTTDKRDNAWRCRPRSK